MQYLSFGGLNETDLRNRVIAAIKTLPNHIYARMEYDGVAGKNHTVNVQLFDKDNCPEDKVFDGAGKWIQTEKFYYAEFLEMFEDPKTSWAEETILEWAERETRAYKIRKSNN